MWFQDDSFSIDYCGRITCLNKCRKGFHLCNECLPTQQDLLSNYIKWNRDYYKNYGNSLAHHDDIYFETNCILTSKMIQEKFDFIRNYDIYNMDVDQFFEKHHGFSQIDIANTLGYSEHTMTIIGNFIVHSFQGTFKLKITPIDKNWKESLKAKDWNKIAQCEETLFTKDEVLFLRYWLF